ncbi:MAG: hypothetical protein L6R43_13530 [Planctomycetes bacterium]|nr:hypothetical protein [Planctomycetota bacterium]
MDKHSGAPRIARGLLPRAAVLAAALASCCLPALARDDDDQFAMRLADRGYEALALQVIDRMSSAKGSPDAKGGAEFARSALLRRAALLVAAVDTSDPAEVRTKFGNATRAYEAFLKSYGSHSRAADAEYDLANLKKDFAYYLQKSLEKFPAAERDPVKAEAVKLFEDAVRYLTSIRDREQQKGDAAARAGGGGEEEEEGKEEREDPYLQRNIAWYYLCVALHDRAMLHPPGDALRLQQFTQAIEETTRFLEETDGTIFGYFASMNLGLCFWHRGQSKDGWSADDVKQATEWFLVNIDASDIPDLDQQWPALARCVYQAADHWGEMCNAVGVLDGVNYRKEFVDKMAKVEAKMPGLRNERFGLEALVQKGLALSGLGRHAAAVETLNAASEAAGRADPSWGRGADAHAKRALNDVVAAIPPDAGVALSPAILFKAAEGSMRDGDFGRAIRVYQRVLASIAAEPDAARRRTLADEYDHACWLKINECYARLDRNLEAYYAADFPVQEYLRAGRKDQDDDVDDLAYFRITALRSVLAKAKPERKEALQKEIEEAQKLFTEKFADWSNMGGSTAYSVAFNKQQEAHAARGRGDRAAAEKAFAECIELFRKVTDKDRYYLNAQSRIGESMVAMGKTDEGMKFLQAFVAKHLEYWKDPNTPTRERQAWGWAVLWIANGHADLKQPAKVVETLADFERSFAAAGLDATFPRVRYLRVLALVDAGRSADAEKECRVLLKENEDSGWTVPAALRVANDLQSQGAKAKGGGDAKASLDLRRRAVEFYEFWLRRSSDVGADQLTFIGQIYNDVLKEPARAAELWTRALKLYEEKGDAEKAELLTVYLSSLLVEQGNYAEALPKFERLFIKVPENIDSLREVFDQLRRRPANVEKTVHEKNVKDLLGKIAEMTATDAAVANLASEARRAASLGDADIMVRAFSDTPDTRKGLATATAFILLGENLPPELKVAVFGLVKRQPDLMSNLGRCYDELWLTKPEFPFRALNLYSTLLDSAPPGYEGEEVPGARYSERWFDWKVRMTRLWFNIGTKFSLEPALRTVCGIVKAMETVNEYDRAEKARQGLSREFQALKDQADMALSKLGKEGCK